MTTRASPKMLEGCDGGQAPSRPDSARGGAEQTGAVGEGCDGGQASSRPSSETGTRRGVKQNTEAEPSSMVAESNHLLSRMKEVAMGYPNLYIKLRAVDRFHPKNHTLRACQCAAPGRRAGDSASP